MIDSLIDILKFEKKAKADGLRFLIGIDEAGRGPLAGPVVAAAVALKEWEFDNKIGDSKKLSERQREKAFEEIFEKAYVGVGIISESVIDEVNILNATYLAMNRAVRQLVRKLDKSDRPNHQTGKLIIDGNSFKSQVPLPYELIIKGDSRSKTIACASIVAKVSRDRIMQKYDKIYPQYGFAKHKGYGTAAHRAAIKEFGSTIIHRKSFTVK